jgi:Rrf2 family iron-sulfur cluster assembly transcriptional regulator
MKLSTKSRYAVMAMVELSTHARLHGIQEPLSLSAIAKKENLPLSYLEQLFCKLRKKNIVQSHRGSSGGYILGNDPKDISILDIVNAVDRPVKVTRCSDKEGSCQLSGEVCITHSLWDELETLIRKFLKTVTLEDVLTRNVAGMGRFASFFTPNPKEGGA